ncbi:MAG: DMT family transporter [Anaerolineae bacterium]|jgi:drug/metabolite transporter (DMT)-like permease
MATKTGSTSIESLDSQTRTTNPALGIASAIVIVFIWSGWLVVTKAGAESTLTIFDIAALRFGLSGLVSLPIVIYFRAWRGLPVHRIAILAVLAGVPYVLLSYTAFTFAPAAYGGVFMNGVLPAMALALGWLWLKERPRRLQVIGAALIIAGAVLAAVDTSGSAASGAWIGAVLFLVAALSFSIYLILNRLWQLTAPQILLSLSVVSAILYVPIWYLFLPSNLAEAPASQIVLQGAYQMLPNLVGFNLLAIAVRNVGAPVTAAIMSAVPSLGAVLGLVLLGETLGALTWIGILILSLGILLTALRARTTE